METQTETTAGRSLFRKLAEVMGEVERVKKSGRNEFHRYDYATEADIVAAVREGMSRRRLMLVPDVESCEVKDLPRKNGTERLATLRVRFTLVDGDSGETHAFHVLGEGTDVGDKATYKAMTGATKYALLKLFLIPTGDDPEQDDAPPQRAPQRQQQRSSPAPAEGRREAPRQQAARETGPAHPPGYTSTQETVARVAQAVGGQVSPTVGYGAFKDRRAGELEPEELASVVAEGEKRLADAPKDAKWRPALERNVKALRAWHDAQPAEPGAAG